MDDESSAGRRAGSPAAATQNPALGGAARYLGTTDREKAACDRGAAAHGRKNAAGARKKELTLSRCAYHRLRFHCVSAPWTPFGKSCKRATTDSGATWRLTHGGLVLPVPSCYGETCSSGLVIMEAVLGGDNRLNRRLAASVAAFTKRARPVTEVHRCCAPRILMTARPRAGVAQQQFFQAA